MPQEGGIMIRTLATALATTTCLVALATPAAAQTREFNVSAGSLRAALDTFARQSGRQVIYRGDEVRSVKSPGVRGARTAEDALEALLSGTGFAAKRDSSGAFAVVKVGNAATAEIASSRDEAATGNAAADGETGDIVVTGTRIAGASPASQVIDVTHAQMLEAGQRDLGEVVRSLPLNFGGGQNPGVLQGASTAAIANQNISNSSSINLRGLGPDATLTLINGRRLSYDSFGQAVDISTIPLAAVESIQIVPDGASALYGSDAVAGVANILLKRDFEGLETSVRLGGATDGGGFQQQYDATSGARWGNGGFLISGQYYNQDAIMSSQRSYTEALPRPADLYPSSKQYSALITAHQDVGSFVTIGIDALYGNRSSFQRVSPASLTTIQDSRPLSKSYTIAPSVTLHLPANWTASANGIFGSNNSYYRSGTTNSIAGTRTVATGCYCNDAKGAEITAEGPLFELPGGTARLALGGGYRENTFFAISDSSDSRQGGSRSSYYSYGEINLPLVSKANDIPGLASLTFSGAVRYERYRDLGGVFTPKIGAIYSPVEGVDIKGTWGRSFKTPTLLQQHQTSYLYLFPANAIGGTGYPATATVLIPFGGNPSLKPERAESWSTTLDVHPVVLEGFRASLSYFHIDYRDRVVQPLNLGSALSNPAYAEFISFNPDATTQANLIANASQFLNFAGTYNPNNVVAVASDLYTNVTRQIIHGIDLSSNYRFSFASGSMNLSAMASWLTSRQLNSATAPVIQLAGYFYNPPHFRARGGATWSDKRVTAAAFLNYIGGVRDDRSVQPVDGESMTTIDATLSYRFGDDITSRRNLVVTLSIQNLTNEAPPYLRPAATNIAPYDSTNYSSTGRFISVAVTRHW